MTTDSDVRVCDLTPDNFGARVTVKGHGSGWLYAIHDDYNDGYPSRSLTVVTNELGDTDEWTFTDSDPQGYPKTMGTPATVDPR
jgi:hypothetical protein